jgi:hypothetical protein
MLKRCLRRWRIFSGFERSGGRHRSNLEPYATPPVPSLFLVSPGRQNQTGNQARGE